MSHSTVASPIRLLKHSAPATPSHAAGSANVDIVNLEATTRKFRSRRSREIEVLEDERRRLARDLHDEAGHRLTAATLQLDVIVERHRMDTELRESLEVTRRLIVECAAGLHEVAFNLHPSILADLGLVPAVRSLVRRAEQAADFPMAVEVVGLPQRIPERIELAAFRIVQEALTNVLKYARPSAATVRITFSEGTVVLEIADDGVGFDVVQEHIDRPRLGLAGIRERTELVGGELRLRTQPGRGTTVWVRLPWSETV
jgi:two-component system sensor histidine kinase NreB